jgi:dihydroorotate dehydrogenase electron transfer subunit
MLNTTILKNTEIASGIFELALRFDNGARGFGPGRFAHIRLPSDKMLLRRPISFNHVDEAEGCATFVYQVVGEGTELLSTLKKGERLDALAPLGRGFWKPEGIGKAALVGGGMGAAPLRMLPEAWPDVAFDAYLGFRGGQYAYQVKEFGALAQNLYLCSDDGTLGDKGFVTCLLDDCPDLSAYDAIYACGPAPMLKALQKLLADRALSCASQALSGPKGKKGGEVPCQASLEERMGCGVGACLVCNCRVREGGEWRYRRVCKDGPVFELMEVDFDGQA